MYRKNNDAYCEALLRSKNHTWTFNDLDMVSEWLDRRDRERRRKREASTDPERTPQDSNQNSCEDE